LKFEKTETGKLRSPLMVVAVSTSIPQYKGLYSQAREMAKFMLKKMDFEKLATIYSSSFAPEVLVGDDGISYLPSCSVYLHRGKSDLLLFAGDSSPMDDQYRFTELLLDYAGELGVKELYSVGARWVETPLPPEQDPEPNGFSTDKAGVAKLKKAGVKVVAEEPAPFFSSMVVGLAKAHGIRGIKLAVDHGEPSPHPRGVVKLLGALSKLAGFEVDVSELRSQAKGAEAMQRPVGDNTIYH